MKKIAILVFCAVILLSQTAYAKLFAPKQKKPTASGRLVNNTGTKAEDENVTKQGDMGSQLDRLTTDTKKRKTYQY